MSRAPSYAPVPPNSDVPGDNRATASWPIVPAKVRDISARFGKLMLTAAQIKYCTNPLRGWVIAEREVLLSLLGFAYRDYGMFDRCSLRLDARRPDHLTPLLRFVGYELAKLAGEVGNRIGPWPSIA